MIGKGGLLQVLLVCCLTLILHSCSSTPQRMIDQNDHAGLAKFYYQEASALNQKAYDWRSLAEHYDEQASKSLAFSCRQIANNYARAAQQAEQLVALHRKLASAQ